MASGFVVAQPQGLPPFLQDPQGIAFEQSFGQTKDDSLSLLKEAVKCRWPDAARPDALPLQGRNVRILRAPPETDPQYAARLLTAPDLWLWAGTPTGMSDIFAPYSYTPAGGPEQTPAWQPNTVYANGDLRLASGNVYEQAAPNGSQSGTVQPSGYGGAGGEAAPQSDSFVDGFCLWNFVRAGTGPMIVVPNYQVILEGSLGWYSRFIMLAGPLYWMSDSTWDLLGTFVDDLSASSWTVPAVAAIVTITFTGTPIWPPNTGEFVQIAGAGIFVLVSHTGSSAVIMNTGLPGNAAPGTVIAPAQALTLVTDIWDDGDALWDSTMTVRDADYIRASVREKKSPWSYPCLLGFVLSDIAGDGIWDLATDVFDTPNTFWSDSNGDVTYLPIAEFWGQEAFYGGGPGVWDGDPSDVWGDYYAPSVGFHLRN